MSYWNQESGESFEEFSERHREERETQPPECSHCHFEITELVNYSKHYGGNVGAHWLCVYCRNTVSASALGAGNSKDQTVADMAAMMNALEQRLKDQDGS